jgi:hypothetical protein
LRPQHHEDEDVAHGKGSEIVPGQAGDALGSTLTLAREGPKDAPAWLRLPRPLAVGDDDDPGTLSEPEPLFIRHQTRGILTITLATPGHSRMIDLDEVVRTLLRGRMLSALPHLQVPTLARGVQLLIDRSDGMLPFLSDLRRIECDIRDVVGSEALDVLRFACCPTRGAGAGPRRTWRDYRGHATPPVGTRVVAITDLGIGSPPGTDAPASASEWISFADHLQRAGCQLIALVPYRASRWPAAVASNIDILHWDSSTTAASAARIVRRRTG